MQKRRSNRNISHWLCAGPQKLVINQIHHCWYKGKGQHEVMSHTASRKSTARVESLSEHYDGAKQTSGSPSCTVTAGNYLAGISVVDKLLKVPRMSVVGGRRDDVTDACEGFEQVTLLKM